MTGVRIEWAKALARKTRWTEEVELLKEEMRRVLRTLRTEERIWGERMYRKLENLPLEELAGRRSYAKRQASNHRRIREAFEQLWRRQGPARGQKEGPKDAEAQAAVAALISEVDAAATTAAGSA